MCCIMICVLLQFNELGFVGFAFGFHEEKTHIVGTSTTSVCFKPKVIEYLHAMIMVSE